MTTDGFNAAALATNTRNTATATIVLTRFLVVVIGLVVVITVVVVAPDSRCCVVIFVNVKAVAPMAAGAEGDPAGRWERRKEVNGGSRRPGKDSPKDL